MGHVTKVRFDQLVVERGLAGTLEKARALILSGRVRAPGLKNVKAGERVALDQALELVQEAPFVSRGGLKLQAALGEFKPDVSGRFCVDIGASTGGFTDCLLKAGAARVLAVDVGHGQLDWSLRNDPRVVNREKTHVLRLTRTDISAFLDPNRGRFLPELARSDAVGLVTVDVSFISLKKVLPHLATLFSDPTHLIVLVKPQFEAEPKDAPKGVVKDPAVRQAVLDAMEKTAGTAGLLVLGKCESPVVGPEGNHEYFLHLRRA